MTRWMCFACALLLVMGCDSPPSPPPADAATDRATDATDATIARCVSDRECSAMGLVCDAARGFCVECNGADDCTGGRMCLGSRCLTPTPCTSSRMCPGQVCSPRLGYCVDCERDVDCTGAQVCRGSVCVAPPRPCRSSRECSDVGLVCDAALGFCVECLTNADCPMSQSCREGTCRAAAACAPGAATCADATTRRVCSADGSAFTLAPCAAGEGCDAGACVTRVCSPGAASCQGASERRVCNADGRGYTTTACAAGELCDAGACVPSACAAGSATCADGTSRRVCNADGRGYTTTACPAMQGCVMGACVAFRCTPGAATCTDATTRSVCGADGQGSTPERCAAMQTCSMGACRPWACTPGAMSCASTSARRVCNADGLANTDTPCAAGEMCAAGACVAPGCTPGSATCADGTTRRVCNADGRGFTNTPCAAGETCSGGACTRPPAPVCTAGAAFCDPTGARRQCNADGSASAAAPCPAGQTCNGAGACLTPTADACPGIDVATDGTPVVVMPSTLTGRVDVGITCRTTDVSPTGDAVFHFRLASPRDVTIAIPTAAGMPMQIQRSCVPGVTRASPVSYCNDRGPYNRRYRNLDAGDYYIVLYYSGTSPISVAVTATDPTARTPGDGCRAAVEVTPDGPPGVVNGIASFDTQVEAAVTCGRRTLGTPGPVDWFWRFRNDRTRDLRLTATGSPRIQVFESCSAAARPVGPCAERGVLDLYSLPPGDYIVLAENAASPMPASSGLTITTLTAGSHTIGENCARPAEIVVGGPASSVVISTISSTPEVGTISGLGSPYGNSQGDVVWHFQLAARASVQFGVTFSDPLLSASVQLQRTCARGAPFIVAQAPGTSLRAYDLAAGDYYIVAELYSRGTSASISAQVTTIPTPPSPAPPRQGDTCATAIPIVPDGPTVTVTPVGTFTPYPQLNMTCGGGADVFDYVLTFTLAREQDVTIQVGGTASSGFEIQTRCDDPSTSVNGCAGSGTRNFPSLRAGTYFILARSTAMAGATATFAVRTNDPGSLPFTYYVSRAQLAPGEFVNACAAPGVIELLGGTRDEFARVPAPFELRVWGAAAPPDQLIGVGSNGFLSLATPLAPTDGSAMPLIPSIGTPQHVVAPFWFSQTVYRQGVCTATLGATPNRRWVVEWVDSNPYSTPFRSDQFNRYEVIFYEGRRDFDLLYEALDLRSERGSHVYVAGVESRDGMQGLDLGLPRPYTRVRLTPAR